MAKKETIAEPLAMPHSPDAERTVLGTFLLNPETVADVQSVLDPEDFFDPRHQTVYEVAIDLTGEGAPIDLMVVCEELKRRGQLERVGGPAYLAGCEQEVIAPGNVLHHAGIVREKARLRHLLRAGLEIAESARLESDRSDELLQASEQKLFSILDDRATGGEFRSLGDDAVEVYEAILESRERGSGTTGVTTGLRDLDTLTGGLQPSDLVILAARPSVGKTALALNIAAAAAKSTVAGADGTLQPAGVGIFSLEMSRRQVIERMVCTEARLSMSLLRKNMLNEDQLALFAQTLEEMKDLRIYVNDTPGMSPVEVQLQAQRLARREPNLALIIIDYLQLMSVKGKRSESRQQEVSEISRAMKGLARDLSVPVLALSQLSRGIEGRSKKEARPRLSDLRESGAIEQDADVVVFIHPDEESRRVNADSYLVSLIVAKQRNGPTDDVQAMFIKEFTLFGNRAVGMHEEDV